MQRHPNPQEDYTGRKTKPETKQAAPKPNSAAHIPEPGEIEPPDENPNALTTEIVVQTFSEVEAKTVEWLWPDRLPKNKLIVFSGNPDVGKSTTVIDIISRYTKRRDYPDGGKNPEPAGEVLMLIAEDNPEDTIKPRLIAAEADVSKVHFVKCVRIRQGARQTERMLALDTDLGLLAETLKTYPGIGLVVFDPVTDYLGKANINKDQEIRRVLTPIKEFAESASVTIIGLGHFNKRSDVTALHRVGGAVAMSGVARAVWLFMKDPDEPGLYKMLLGKGNLTKKRSGLKYHIVEKDTVVGGQPVIEWAGETSDCADDVMVEAEPDTKKLGKAKRFLEKHFEEHPGLQASKPIIDAAEAKGISAPTLFRARKALGIGAYKEHGSWMWEPKGESEKWSG